MNHPLHELPPGFEPERYELDEKLPYRFAVDRRDFIKSVGAGILILSLVDRAVAQESGGGRRRFGGRGGAPQDIAAWLHIDENGQITVFTGKVEVGQNIRTSLTQAVAEELPAPLDSIRLVMGDTELTPYDMGTFGSRTTPDMNPRLRQVAAAARELLIDLAAEQWKTDRSSLSADQGKIVNQKNQAALAYGALTHGRKLTQAVSERPQLTPASEWNVASQSIPKIGADDIVTGKHQYPSDIKRPGMLYGKVLRPPSFGAKLKSVNTKAAEALPGVVAVHDGDFVGVVAPTEFEAERALRTIQSDWQSSPRISDKELFEHLKKTGRNGGGGFRGGRGGGQTGSIEDGLAAADVKLNESYTIAYIAHTPLEPRAAVAEWNDGKLTVWTGTQRPFGVRGELTGAFHLSDEQVHVLMPDMGSGYGGKHTGEAAVEAARLAKGAGKPVKLVWTREEEFTWAYFRPAGVIDVRSGAKKDGTLTAWEYHNYNSGGSGIRTFYEVPNQQIEFHSADSPLRQGSYRGLAATANHFARETHMDELAHALQMDPLEFRLKNLKDPRLRAVFQAAADKFGWTGAQPAKGRGFGIGGGSEKGSYVATCAEVAVDPDDGRVNVIRAVTAFECGAIVNPDHLRNQAEGALVMGLGGALFEAIRFEEGRILNPHFANYRVPRFKDAPQIDIVLLDRKDTPSAGAGETPIVGIAPAIGNAIFAATGVRLRSMPLAPRGVKV